MTPQEEYIEDIVVNAVSDIQEMHFEPQFHNEILATKIRWSNYATQQNIISHQDIADDVRLLDQTHIDLDREFNNKEIIKQVASIASSIGAVSLLNYFNMPPAIMFLSLYGTAGIVNHALTELADRYEDFLTIRENQQMLDSISDEELVTELKKNYDNISSAITQITTSTRETEPEEVFFYNPTVEELEQREEHIEDMIMELLDYGKSLEEATSREEMRQKDIINILFSKYSEGSITNEDFASYVLTHQYMLLSDETLIETALESRKKSEIIAVPAITTGVLYVTNSPPELIGLSAYLTLLATTTKGEEIVGMVNGYRNLVEEKKQLPTITEEEVAYVVEKNSDAIKSVIKEYFNE